jgi:cob(I)alamin adenosyltransferase
MTQPQPKARILLFTGDGKGKTTAALGLVLRAAGYGMKVRVIQFIKTRKTGELDALRQFPQIEFTQPGRGFVFNKDMPDFAEHQQAAAAGLALADAAIRSGAYQLVVLDEICNAITAGLLNEAEVLEVVSAATPEMIVVLTGRGATPRLIELADTVTEMRCVKHGIDTGHAAQKGVEL